MVTGFVRHILLLVYAQNKWISEVLKLIINKQKKRKERRERKKDEREKPLL